MYGADVVEDVGGRRAAQATQGEDLWRARRSAWRQSTKPAQIGFGGSVLDCVLVDASRGGAQVRLLEAAEVPEIVTLRLSDGRNWTVRRQWQRGAQIGFKVVIGA
jgi:hypothetical protein